MFLKLGLLSSLLLNIDHCTESFSGRWTSDEFNFFIAEFVFKDVFLLYDFCAFMILKLLFNVYEQYKNLSRRRKTLSCCKSDFIFKFLISILHQIKNLVSNFTTKFKSSR